MNKQPQQIVTHTQAMRSDLQVVSTSQGGIFARRQALLAGYTPKEFDWMTRPRTGAWLRVRYGVYVVRADWESLDQNSQALLRDRAALLVCDAGTVLSHSAATRVWSLPLYDVDDGLTHVTRLHSHERQLSRIQAGIKHHTGRLGEDEIESLRGVLVTSAARTVLDVTSEFGYRSGLVVADSALHAGLDRAELVATLERCPHDAHAPVRRAVVADADGRAETPIETLARILLRDMGVFDLTPQYEISLPGGGKAFADLYSPVLHHVFECDGKLKYRSQVDARGKLLDAQQVVYDEKLREDAIRGCGFGVSRILWRDTMPDSLGRASARLWREIRYQNAARLYQGSSHPA